MDQPGKAANPARGQLNSKSYLIEPDVGKAESLDGLDEYGQGQTERNVSVVQCLEDSHCTGGNVCGCSLTM